MNKMAVFFRESKAARFLIPVGITLIIFGILLFVVSKNNKDYIETEATVSKVELYSEESFDVDGNVEPAQYTIYVKYMVDEKEYENELGIMFEMKVGDKVTIVYNPKDPNQISQPSSLLLNIIILVSGVASLVGGIISAVNAVKRQRKLRSQEEKWENGN